MLPKVFAALLVLLLLSLDFTLQTSSVLEQTTYWTPWLFKVGPMSVSDIVIIAVAGYTLFMFCQRPAIPNSPYLLLCSLLLLYLAIGMIYNIEVFTLWKTYLYDVKMVMCLIVPYFFLFVIRAQENIIRVFTPKKIFIYGAVGAVLDFSVVNIWGQSEYPSFLGYPPILSIVPLSVIGVGLLYATDTKNRTIFIALLLCECVNAINRLSLGSIFNAIVALAYMGVLTLSKNIVSRALIVSLSVVAINVTAIILMENPINSVLLDFKREGAVTRQVQLENVVENFGENIHGIFGKGLGSTWFEFVSIPEGDIYSVGISVAESPGSAMSMPVKFIFNWTPPSLLYKWGIVGSLMLCLAMAVYYEHNWVRIQLLVRRGLSKEDCRYLKAILGITAIYIMENYTYIGLMRAALITSLLTFYLERSIEIASIQGKVVL